MTKKALINENADRAEKLAEQLKTSQRELSALAAYKLANPFQEWEDSLARIRAGMASIGVPVAPISPQGTITGQMPEVPSIVPPGQSGFIPPSITQETQSDAPLKVSLSIKVVWDTSADTVDISLPVPVKRTFKASRKMPDHKQTNLPLESEVDSD